jgi:hypothetical protein
MKLYQIQVKDESKGFYFPLYLHSGIGFVWDKDDDHITFKFIRQSDSGDAFISSPTRYIRDDINISLVASQDDMYISKEKS